MRQSWLLGVLLAGVACGGGGEDEDIFSPVGGGGSSATAGAGGSEAGGAGGSEAGGVGGSEVGGEAGVGGDAGSAGDGGSAGEGGSAGDGGAAGDAGAGQGGVTGGGVIRIRMTATTAPFPHGDGLSGQTPITHKSGLRSYRLFKDKNDAVGVPVFDLGKGFVEVSYDNGADTLVTEVPVTSIPEGVYTRAQVVHTHVRYRIKATAHNGNFAVPGEFDNVQVMSDGTTLDGVERQGGYYRYVFKAPGFDFPLEGQGAPIPTVPSSGGFSVSLVNGQWIYEFPVAFTIDHGVKGVVDTALHVNMFESFRWKDENKPGYAPKIFDVTAGSFEPVLRFGANSFEVKIKPGGG